MLCLGISDREIENVLSKTKVAFSNITPGTDASANLEQYVKALKIAVDTLTRMKKDGKRALNKAQNFNLKKEVEDVYKELTDLQEYSGPDKVQKCFRVAGKWRNGVDVLEPTHPQPQPPVYEGRTSIDNESISSGGSDSIPDEFYQVDIPSGSEDTFDEEDFTGDTSGYNENTLNLLRIDEFDDGQSDQCLSHPSTQRERYEKHTGRFADAAPRLALSNIEMEYPEPSILQTKEHHKDDRSVTQHTSTDDIPAATIASEAVGSGPTDAELTSKVHELLMGVDLMTITKKQLRQQLEGIYGVDLTSRRDFLSKTIDAELIRMDSTFDTPSPQKPTATTASVPQKPTTTIASVESQPTDAELVSMIHEILMVADFSTATKKKIRQQMEGIYGVDLIHRRDLINRTIDEEVNQRLSARPRKKDV
ncbi:MAG: DEK C terminal domain-containing protein [Benniella sp.]|nr:MAG: DEK C terminal domain-containing protein [Benniella sp.]